MDNIRKIIPLLYSTLIFFTICNYTIAGAQTKEIQDYWYRGAEITSYALEQARYGEIHKGSAVIVFVTEDFLPNKQVKSESPTTPLSEVVPILKLNLIKKFTTGIYDYSTMSSVFTPVNLHKYPGSLKVSGSSQEWCGNVYTQINNRKDHYDVTLHSYFEREADKISSLKPVLLEDEIWTKIRLSPSTLPTGYQEIIPGVITSRLLHNEIKTERAQTSMWEKSNSELVYTVEYNDLKRKLSITFMKNFPHEIITWEETYPAIKGGRILTTRAIRKHTMIIDYWNKNRNSDAGLRKELGLAE